MMSQLVCYYCKLIKKKCDKRLPSCTRCARSATKSVLFQIIKCDHRRGAVCDYKARTNLTKEQELQILRDKFESLEQSFYPTAQRQRLGSPPHEVLAHLTPHKNSRDNNHDKRQGHPKFTADHVLQTSTLYAMDTENIHALAYKHVCSIFEHGNTNFTTVCGIYFNTVHKWLPILTESHIYNQIRHTTVGIPRGDFAILLVALYLIIQLPARSKLGSTIEHSLPIYSTVKALNAQIQALLPPSIYLLQAQLIITTFEHGQGLLTASYMSIGACARSSEILALDRHAGDVSNRRGNFPDEDPGQLDDERRLWWGCTIRDRYVSLSL